MTEHDLRDALPGIRPHVTIQSGAGTHAPVYIAADADYEAGDGNCGLHEDEKYANEPAILYVRADLLINMRAERDALREEVKRLRAALERIAVTPHRGRDWMQTRARAALAERPEGQEVGG